uniref:Reverse transcriptase domain-containing protein n=1 Tax=Tanacetum cinerariifolium TaxID=118510 RepID=A0A699HNI7_TANCI|nr:hypothetical protein [Tanacetum cinerariifolium]
MPPRRLRRSVVERLIADRVAEAITEHEIGLRRWFEKVEQVFEISKCVREDKDCLFEQAIQAKSIRIGESNKRRLEEHQGSNSNRNHNIHHQQQNRRQEGAKAYTAAPAERKGYFGTRPLCNQCNLHMTVSALPSARIAKG